MKRLLLIPGVVLSTAAFFAAALELAARASTPDLPLAPGFGAVLRTLAPDLLDAARARFPWTGWDALLALPGWLSLGAPGLTLIWFGRSGRRSPEDAEDEEALFLFDELAKQARAEGYTDTGDDIAPSDHADMDLADERYAQDSIVDDVRPERDLLLGSARAEGARKKQERED